MREREFTVNVTVPITVSIPADNGSRPSRLAKPGIPVNKKAQNHSDEVDTKDVFIPPLQQKIELMKAAAGKSSPAIGQLTSDEDDLLDS
jgi:hypothetical protein